MGWQDRIVDDGADRERWLRARSPMVCASDVAKYARAGSADKYTAEKLARRTFSGNANTADGHRWEPMMLAWAGIPQNLALVHSVEERMFGATPDGISVVGDRLAECKVKHLKVIDGPDAGEWRQLAWHFFTFPEATETEFLWAELNAHGELRDALKGEPKHMTIKRSDPRITAALNLVLPIAREVLGQLTAALEFERQLAS